MQLRLRLRNVSEQWHIPQEILSAADLPSSKVSGENSASMAKRMGSAKQMRMIRIAAILPLACACGLSGAPFSQEKLEHDGAGTWTFAVSGDSRNCGDIVMPAIGASVRRKGAAFFWLLGDLRKTSDFDEDMQHQPANLAHPLSVRAYIEREWPDFIESQANSFGDLPFFLGIGNHDTTPPKTREQFMIQFADWLDSPVLRAQRLRDDPADHALRTYFHWIQGGVDFISLDNATEDQFDEAQMKWFEKVLQADAANTGIRSIVVGMHKPLPESISKGHGMNESPTGIESGRRAYRDLLEAQNRDHKHVYVLQSHSHYFMEGIFNTEYWRTNGGVLPGWIVGTAGAVRYKLPPEAGNARAAETNVYGYLLGSVKPDREINIEFVPVNEPDVPTPIVERYTPKFVHWCFAENSAAH
jgi:Calcineurin-like phosphoesterase